MRSDGRAACPARARGRAAAPPRVAAPSRPRGARAPPGRRATRSRPRPRARATLTARACTARSSPKRAVNSRHQSAASQSRRPQEWSRLPVPSTRQRVRRRSRSRPAIARTARRDARPPGSARARSVVGQPVREVDGGRGGRRSAGRTARGTSRGASSSGTGPGGKPAASCEERRPSKRSRTGSQPASMPPTATLVAASCRASALEREQHAAARAGRRPPALRPRPPRRAPTDATSTIPVAGSCTLTYTLSRARGCVFERDGTPRPRERPPAARRWPRARRVRLAGCRRAAARCPRCRPRGRVSRAHPARGVADVDHAGDAELARHHRAVGQQAADLRHRARGGGQQRAEGGVEHGRHQDFAGLEGQRLAAPRARAPARRRCPALTPVPCQLGSVSATTAPAREVDLARGAGTCAARLEALAAPPQRGRGRRGARQHRAQLGDAEEEDVVRGRRGAPPRPERAPAGGPAAAPWSTRATASDFVRSRGAHALPRRGQGADEKRAPDGAEPREDRLLLRLTLLGRGPLREPGRARARGQGRQRLQHGRRILAPGARPQLAFRERAVAVAVQERPETRGERRRARRRGPGPRPRRAGPGNRATPGFRAPPPPARPAPARGRRSRRRRGRPGDDSRAPRLRRAASGRGGARGCRGGRRWPPETATCVAATSRPRAQEVAQDRGGLSVAALGGRGPGVQDADVLLRARRCGRAGPSEPEETGQHPDEAPEVADTQPRRGGGGAGAEHQALRVRRRHARAAAPPRRGCGSGSGRAARGG